jgi:putative CocE/NonD family hydrolase
LNVVAELPHAVRVIENTWIPLADGVRLAARIWLPEGAQQRPVPAVLEYLPYRKRDFTRFRDEPIHHYFAGHGFASLRVDIRGSGDSDGILTDEYSAQEHADALEVLHWIAEQPWCSGNIGMMGISWGGFNSLQVAALRPPELKAIITLCSTDDRYADDAHYMGGCLLNENLQWGAILLTYQALPPDPQVVGDRWRELWRERLEQVVPFPEHWLRHQRRDDYWRHGSVCEDYSRITCPVYAIGGWADGYSNAVPRLLAGLRGPKKGLIGPWAHTFPQDGVPGPAIGFLQEALRWWRQWLSGEDTGIMAEPLFRVWMQDSVEPLPTRETWPGRWVAEESWPSPKLERRVWVLNAGGLGDTADAAEGEASIASPQTTGLSGGEWCAFGAEGEMPGDQRPDDGRSLCFDSEPLPERLEILGAPALSLELRADRPVALVAVRLCEVAADGTSLRVSYGLLNLTHRNSHEHTEPVEPGRRQAVRIQLNDCAHAFPAGSRLRVALSTAYWPIAWPPPQPVTLHVATGASTLELPVRAPRPEDAALPDFEPPERGPTDEPRRLRAAPFRRTIERDLAANEILHTLISDAADLGGAALARVEAIGLDVGHTIERRYAIGESDPLSARAEIDQRTDLRRGDWKVRVETRTRLTASVRHFRFEADLDAFEGDERTFHRRWDEQIPRDGV